MEVIPTNLISKAAAGLQGPDWLQRVRADAQIDLGKLDFPTADAEIWRYSRINDLNLDAFNPSTEVSTESVSGSLADLVEAVGVRAGLVVTHNGRVTRVEVDEQLETKGLRLVSSDAWADGAGFSLDVEKDAADYFSTLNAACVAEPVLIDVPAGVVVEEPIVIVHWIDQADIATFPRAVVRVGENAQATVVECFSSADVRALVVPMTTLDVGAAANLQYLALQTLGTQVWQIARQVSQVEQDATLRSTTVALGGDYARVSTESHLIGKGATSKLSAVYFGNDNQMHDFRTLQGHEAPKSTSDLLFKGAVGGTARSVYSGLIRVRKGAAGTNAFQTNRNLVLSPGAHADSVPNLEIEENDVRCSHASAVGPVDEDQRYYLHSRGVPPEIADRLIVLGFLDELLVQIPVKGLHETLKTAVAQKLDNLDAQSDVR